MGIDIMNQAAAPSSGKDLDKLVKPEIDLDTNIEIGTIKVLRAENECTGLPPYPRSPIQYSFWLVRMNN